MSVTPQRSFEALVADLDDTQAFRDAKLQRLFALRLVKRLPLTRAEEGWLGVAYEYAEGRETDANLEKVRVEAWNSLGKRSCEFQDPAVNQTRAVICLLFPNSGAEDWLDQIINVQEFFVAAGGSEQEAIETLYSVWPGV